MQYTTPLKKQEIIDTIMEHFEKVCRENEEKNTAETCGAYLAMFDLLKEIPIYLKGE